MLRSLVTNVENQPVVEKVEGIIYKVHCSCDSTYVWGTVRTIGLCLKEHGIYSCEDETSEQWHSCMSMPETSSVTYLVGQH